MADEKIPTARTAALARIRRLVAGVREAQAAGDLPKAREASMRAITECLRAQIGVHEIDLPDLGGTVETDAAERQEVALSPGQLGGLRAMQLHYDAAGDCPACGHSMETPCLRHRVFVLAGAAGSGKSTLAGEVLRRYGRKEPLIPEIGQWIPTVVAMAAPTNQAALRLLQITGVCAGTYHRIAYERPVIDADTGALLGFVRREEGTAAISGGALLILDEGSMADEVIRDALLDALPVTVRLLVIGDPCQVPPVKGRPGFDLEHPDWMLDEVHRQKGGVLLDAVTRVRRERMRLTPREISSLGAGIFDLTPENLGQAIRIGQVPIVLCRTNAARWQVICAARAAHGWGPPKVGPRKGERVVAFTTNHNLRIANGEAGTVVFCQEGRPVGGESTWYVKIEWDGRGIEGVVVPQASWCSSNRQPWDPQEIAAPVARLRSQYPQPAFAMVALQSGYALTAHKAQGSEWPGGAILVETGRGLPARADDWKIAYTLISRFKSWVDFVRIVEPVQVRALPTEAGSMPFGFN